MSGIHFAFIDALRFEEKDVNKMKKITVNRLANKSKFVDFITYFIHL